MIFLIVNHISNIVALNSSLGSVYYYCCMLQMKYCSHIISIHKLYGYVASSLYVIWF